MVAIASLATWLLLALTTVAQYNVSSSNSSTNALPITSDDQRLVLELFGQPPAGPIATADLLPFVDPARSQIPDRGLYTQFLFTDSHTPASAISGRINFISCTDDLSSYLGPSDVVRTAIANEAAAIVLYSPSVTYCNYTVDASANAQVFTRIFTMTSSSQTAAFLNNAPSARSPASVLNAWVVRQIASNSTLPTDSSGSNKNASSSNSNGNAGNASPSATNAPSTAVAMIILYSITGVITALFLIIIITGAVRAHRHPERYGPRNVTGRPRQTRARGIARAMLDSIPIVKFGEREEQKPTDVELAESSSQRNAQDGSQADGTTAEGGIAAADGTTGARAADVSPTPPAEDNLGCSICTDDFETGQDVRVLPCNHQFHPACIDPWLLNVSGTCPLCRIDLRPVQTNPSSAATSPTTSEHPSNPLAPPLNEIDPNRRASRRLSNLFGVLDRNRLASAPPQERIAALRELREQQVARGDTAEDAAERRRRHRLTAQLQNIFSVRTRGIGVDGQPGLEASGANAPATPAQEGSPARSINGETTARPAER